MSEYVRHQNFKGKRLFYEQMEKYKAYCRSAMSPEQQRKLEGIRTKIAEHKTGNKILSQALILTPDNIPQNIRSLQIIPNSQKIPSYSFVPDQSTSP